MLSPTIYKRSKQYMRQDVLRAFVLYACDEYFRRAAYLLHPPKYPSRAMMEEMKEVGAI